MVESVVNFVFKFLCVVTFLVKNKKEKRRRGLEDEGIRDRHWVWVG